MSVLLQKKQLEYGDKWVSEWKFSPEMLREAYERCVDTKGTMNLRYIDGILKRWNASNLHTLDELHKYEKSASKPSQKQSSSYDINELDKFNSLDNFLIKRLVWGYSNSVYKAASDTLHERRLNAEKAAEREKKRFIKKLPPCERT